MATTNLDSAFAAPGAANNMTAKNADAVRS
jgi:hypothetical protein